MKIIRTASEMQAFSQQAKAEKTSIGFVPTMGALHEGHLSLMRKARELADRVVVSIFVNPTQFDRKDDLEKYPRVEEDDLKKCDVEKVDVVFVPSTEEIYPEGPRSTVEVPSLAKVLCGASRPGHFEGVATVVFRLFEIVEPDSAVFGEKDYQQLALIRWLVCDKKLPIQIVGHPTIREADGLAMSSRNRRLSAEERKEAFALYRSIQAVEAAFRAGERNVANLTKVALEVLEASPVVRIDYAEIRDAETLEEIQEIKKQAVYAVAAFVGPVRLIDNCVLKT